jgi:Ni,Fe-hydrogenase I cytochrome b subunit
MKRLREFNYDARYSMLGLICPPLLLIGLMPDRSKYKYHNKLALLDHTFFYVLIVVLIIALFGLYRLSLFARFVLFFNAVISALMLYFFWDDKKK